MGQERLMGFMILERGGSCDGHTWMCRSHCWVRVLGIMVGKPDSKKTDGIARMFDVGALFIVEQSTQ